MKVVYTIFTTSHGNGGHFYSLVSTAKAMADNIDVIIINFGFNKSPVIDNSGIKHYNILLDKKTLLSSYAMFKGIIKEEKPDVFHSFCTLSYFFVRIYALFNPVKKALTKCGGPNPKKYYPYTNSLVVYSNENYEFFKNSVKFTSTNLHVIPNRVLEPKSNNNRVTDLKKQIEDVMNIKIFLRIGRIANHYKATILQSVQLVEKLNRKGYPSLLLLIGSVQNKDVYEEINRLNTGNILILSEKKYTTEASELIDIADFVIGTGRSLMEAAAKQKILLTPNMKSRYPILVNNDNIRDLLKSNFSPRNNINQKDTETVNEIIRLFKSDSAVNSYKFFSRNIFNKYFDISEKLDTYLNFYNNLKTDKENLSLDFVFHFFFLKKHLIKE